MESGPRLWVDSWLRELDNGTPDAFAGVLLLCLANLEILQIGIGFQQPASCIGVLLRNSILFESLSPRLLPACNKLRVVEMGLNEEIMAQPSKPPIAKASEYDQHLPLFYLPSIRRLSIVMPDLSASHKFTWPAEAPNASSLATLELPFTHFPEDDLGHLLEACPNLKTMKYDFWALGTFKDHTRQHEGTIDLAKLERSLSKVRIHSKYSICNSLFEHGLRNGSIPTSETGCLSQSFPRSAHCTFHLSRFWDRLPEAILIVQ